VKALGTGQMRLCAWAGLIGSSFFVAVFVTEGWLRPDYEPLKMYVSALSLGPRGWIQIANFLILGLCLLTFAWGVANEFRTGKASRSGPVLLAIIAFLLLISGPLIMDPTDTPLNRVSVHGTLHGLAGGIVFILMPISCFVFLHRFRVDPNWQSLRLWTLVLAIVIATASILLTIASKVPEAHIIFDDWLGLIQRAIIIPFMVWVFVFALRLLSRSNLG